MGSGLTHFYPDKDVDQIQLSICVDTLIDKLLPCYTIPEVKVTFYTSALVKIVVTLLTTKIYTQAIFYINPKDA